MDTAISLLLAYKYFVLFPLAIVEGPILTVACGFLVTQGVMDPRIVYALVVIADIIGDGLYYALGRHGARIVPAPLRRFIKISPEKIALARKIFDHHGRKTVIGAKLFQGGPGFLGLMAAGHVGMPYWRFFATAVAVSLGQTAVYLAIGVAAGHAVGVVGERLGWISAAGLAITVAVAGFFVVKFLLRRGKK